MIRTKGGIRWLILLTLNTYSARKLAEKTVLAEERDCALNAQAIILGI